MAVNLTVSETRGGAGYSDSLAGGSTGIDFGQSSNGSYTPLVDQPTNDGAKIVYIRHDAVVDPITAFKTFVQQYTGTYGGANTAAADFTTLKNKGFASGSSNANNADGLYSGLVVDMDWDVSQANQFAPTRIGSGGGSGLFAYIYGDGVGTPTDGIDLSSGFTIKASAMLYNNAGVETAPTTPVDGSLGKSADSVLGDHCKLRYRFYLETSASEGGILQFDLCFSYSYTA